MADELAPLVAAETDPVRVREMTAAASKAAVEEVEREWSRLVDNAKELGPESPLSPTAKSPTKRKK
jgi:hypothetical protein